ncbi:MAG: hypothetical protein EOO77_07390 [Oxalobacteraceae bacterium]|nr:MAG: hypothetical protein EOO77_07390 [Oxalobacteraceae bacterium]
MSSSVDLFHATSIYSYFDPQFEDGCLSDLSVEMLKWSRVIFSNLPGCADLTQYEIEYFAEFIVQLTLHDVPDLLPGALTQEVLQCLNEASTAVMSAIVMRPDESLDVLMRENPRVVRTPSERFRRYRHAILCVLADRSCGVEIRLSDSYEADSAK